MNTPLRLAVLDIVPGLLVDCAFYLDLFALGFLVERAGGSSLDVSLVFGVYTLAYALLAPLLGRASDRGDRRLVLRASSLLFAAIPAGLAATLLVEQGAGAGTASVSDRLGVGPLPLIYAASGLFALSNALFWPALQARIGDRERDPEARGRAIRRFNVGWTVGKALGFLVSGAVFQYAPAACLPLGAVLGGAVLALLLAVDRDVPSGGAPDPAPAAPAPTEGIPQVLKRAYLLAGLATNFAVWGSLSTLQSLAPKLAESLALSPSQAGALVCAALSAQGLVFFGLGGSRAWAYRPWTLVASAPACAAGLALLLAAQGFALAVLGALLVGGAQAITYAASVFYALDYDERRGLRTGIHEANLALAGAVPILGGWAADRLAWLRAPLLIVLLPCLAVALATAILLPRASAARDS